MSEMFDFKNYLWRKMANNGDGEFAFSICQIRHFAIAPQIGGGVGGTLQKSKSISGILGYLVYL